MVRDRAILSEFLIHRVVQECTIQREKIQISPILAAIMDFSGKFKVNISETIRDSEFERNFDPQGITRVSYAKGKNFNFCHFWQPSWI